ncbi:MAG TPA: polyphosphate polymerase domain-containing protein, partial [Rhabdochlamydiaceae bacterium]
MNKKSPNLNLHKAEDPEGYKKEAAKGIMVGYPVKIAGQHARPDNGIHYHSTVKFFNPEKDHVHAVHQIAQHLPLNPPDARNTQIKPDQFKDKNGNDVFVLTLHGNSADKIKEHNGKFAGMGYPTNYEFKPHVSVDKATWDKIKTSGAKTAHEAGIEFGNAELKHGPKVIRTYHHAADTTDPKVPDEGDLTAKVPAVPQFTKSENLCDLHKSDAVKGENETDEDAHALLNRKEDKYFLPRKYIEQIISELSTRFVLGDIDTDTRYSRNKTIYLDDKDLTSLRDVVSKVKPRTKVRIRQYSPNNQGWEEVAYVEFKVKDEDGQTKKVRVRIPADYIDELAEGGKIVFDEQLVNINRDIDRSMLQSRVAAINNAIMRKGLHKQLETQYERRAYSGKSIRITIDDDLNFYDSRPVDPLVRDNISRNKDWPKFLKPYLQAAWDNPLILEVKSGEDVPSWLKKLLKDCEAVEVSFSKYAAAMVTHLRTSEKDGKVLTVYEEPPGEMHKSESSSLKPLMKPYVSLAQERWAHTPTGEKALGGKSGVHEWDEATKGKKLPEKVTKSETGEQKYHIHVGGKRVTDKPLTIGEMKVKTGKFPQDLERDPNTKVIPHHPDAV